MAKVVVKIPKDKKKVRIIRDSELIRRQYSRDLEEEATPEPVEIYDEEKPEEPIDLPDELADRDETIPVNTEDEECEDKNRKCKQVIYSQRFQISESNQPVNISLEKVKEESITLAQAKEEIQDAYDKGFNDGQDAARAIYDTELKDKIGWIKRIDSIIEKMDKEFNAELHKFEEIIVKSAVMIAEKILDEEVTSGSEIVVNQVKKAILQLDDEKIFTIKVCPDDLSILNEVKSDLVHDPEMIRRTKIIPDKKLEKGDIVLETEAGKIDARLKTQLDRIEKVLENTISNSASDIFKSGKDLSE